MNQMKDSGIAWIGEIPEEWKIVKIKYYSYLKGRIGWQGLKASEFIDDGPFLVTGTDFENGKVNWDTAYHISLKRYQEAPEIQLKVGDLLITKDGTVGKLALIDYLPDKASLNSHLVVIRPLKNIYLNKYLFWTLSSTEFTNYIKLKESGSTMASLSQEKLNDFIFQVPQISEQTAIAAFLDKKCALIDSIANDIERQIEILKQYKQSLITETVTKGLDKNVKMKDSGVEWCKSIPEKWNVKRLKFACLKITDGSHFSPETVDNGRKYVTVSNVYSDAVHLEEANMISDENYKVLVKNGCKPKAGDVLLTKDGTVGRSVIVDENNDYVVLSSLGILTPNDFLLPEFLKYSLDATYMQEQMLGVKDGSALKRITITKINEFYILLPSYAEQQDIADFLDSRCAKIDAVITDKQTQLDTLKKHKQSLIYEYVTGKKRVAGAA